MCLCAVLWDHIFSSPLEHCHSLSPLVLYFEVLHSSPTASPGQHSCTRPGLYRAKQSNAPGKVRQEMPALEVNDGKKDGRRGRRGEQAWEKERRRGWTEKKLWVVPPHMRTCWDLSLYLSIYLSIYLYIYLSIYLTVCLLVFKCLKLSTLCELAHVCLSMCVFICLYVCGAAIIFSSTQGKTTSGPQDSQLGSSLDPVTLHPDPTGSNHKPQDHDDTTKPTSNPSAPPYHTHTHFVCTHTPPRSHDLKITLCQNILRPWETERE